MKLISKVVYQCLSSFDHSEYLKGVEVFQGSILEKLFSQWFECSKCIEIQQLRQEFMAVVEYAGKFEGMSAYSK